MRTRLVELLAKMWRQAENLYLTTDDMSWKMNLAHLQDYLKLSEAEYLLLENLCTDLAI